MNDSGLTFGAVKDVLSKVAANGICPDDPRLMTLTNEATLELMFARDPQTNMTVIPVGCMMTADITADGTTLFLPKELRNVIEAEVQGYNGVRGKHDTRQGWYDIVNPFTYVDPNLEHDNPLVDLGLFPDPEDPTIQRRKYDYPGLDEGATVRVTGAKAYLPITADDDYLLVQNVPALKLMMLSIHHRENNDRDGGKAYKEDAVGMLIDEIKAFQLDPKQTLKRKAGYEADLVNLAPDSFGYMRARLAFELPGALQMGKSELTRLLEMAEQRLMAKGHWVGTLEEFRADVENGQILAPDRVKTILAADICGQPLNIRNIFFQYVRNGPGRMSCGDMLIDQGEYYDTKTKKRYRQYRLGGEDMTQYFARSATTTQTGTIGEKGDTGPPGTPGSIWRTGVGAPSSTLGIDNDFYLDTAAFNLYQKVSGGYVLVGSIQGPPGSDNTNALTLNLEGLTGGGTMRLDGVDVDALGIGLNDARIVIVDGSASVYQILDGVPDVNDVAVLNHADWHWQRTL